MATGTGTRLTRADLDGFPDDGHRYELVAGELLVSPLARARHQRVVGRITRRLLEWADEHRGTVYPGVNVDLAEDTHLEPDVAWAATEADPGLGFDATPELVVEVASPSTRGFDRGVKRVRYAASGCREMWLVDLDAEVTEQYEVVAGRTGDPATHRRGETFTSALLDGLVLDVDDLLGRPVGE